MPMLNGLDAARQLKQLMPDSKLIFLTMHATPAYVAEAFKVGASSICSLHSLLSAFTDNLQDIRKQHT